MRFQWLVWGAAGMACVMTSPRPAKAQPWPPGGERPATVLSVDVLVPWVLWTPQQEQKWAQNIEAARAQGPFKMLLRQFKAPKDPAPWEAVPPAQTAPAQATQLPAPGSKPGLNGFKIAPVLKITDPPLPLAPLIETPPPTAPEKLWSYVEPCWYQWRDRIVPDEAPPAPRDWGPEQATGAPDSFVAGDVRTAWASLTPDGGPEWLMLEFASPVVPTALRIRETFNPGAINRITMFALDGSEVPVWNGQSPTRAVKEGVAVFELRFNPFEPLGRPYPGPHLLLKTNRVKLYLDSAAVPGWNEIDAVSLAGADGVERWATSAASSSTYAEPNAPVFAPAVGADGFVPEGAASDAELSRRVEQLEAEVKILRDEVKALRAQVAESVRQAPHLR